MRYCLQGCDAAALLNTAVLVACPAQARSCSLTMTISSPNLFGWEAMTGAQPGLLETLRVLDLGGNWELAEADVSSALSALHLWEL